MKKLLFISLLTIAPCNIHQRAEAKQIVIDIPDDEIEIVEVYVVDAEQWIKDAWAGKVNSRKETLIKDEIKHRVDTGAQLPRTVEEAIQAGKTRLGKRSDKDKEKK